MVYKFRRLRHFNKYYYTSNVQSRTNTPKKSSLILIPAGDELDLYAMCGAVLTFNSVIQHIYYSKYGSMLTYAMNALCTFLFTWFHKSAVMHNPV